MKKGHALIYVGTLALVGVLVFMVTKQKKSSVMTPMQTNNGNWGGAQIQPGFTSGIPEGQLFNYLNQGSMSGSPFTLQDNWISDDWLKVS